MDTETIVKIVKFGVSCSNWGIAKLFGKIFACERQNSGLAGYSKKPVWVGSNSIIYLSTKLSKREKETHEDYTKSKNKF